MPSMAAAALAGGAPGIADHHTRGGNDFRFFLSRDVGLPLSFRVVGLVPDRTLLIERSAPDLFVECALYIDGIQFGLPANTSLKSSGSPYCWNELITLTAKYRDLMPLSQLAFTVWDVSSGENGNIVGGTTISLFNSKKQLKTGRQRLRLWPNKMADGNLSTSTPGKVPKTKRDEVERLERAVNKYMRGQIQHINWLDYLTANAVDKLEKESESTENMYSSLIVELCSFGHRVVFQESGEKLHAPAPSSLADPSKHKLVIACDPEIGRTNPSEHKHLVLAWSLARGVVDEDMKPSSVERKLIQRILKYPPTRALSVDEKQLLWRFRFYLTSEKKALIKFLLSVEWSDIQEAKQAVALIRRWETIDVADALGLLSPFFQNEEVRAYAVNVLERADDEELQCYLLQLVQALRFERSDKSRLAHFLVNRSLSNFELASFLRWYLVVELHDPTHARRYLCTYEMLEDSIMRSVSKEDGDEDGFQLWQSLTGQAELTGKLCSIVKDMKEKYDAQSKGKILEQLLSGIYSEFTNFSEPIPSPLAPSVLLAGIVPQESLVFRSCNYPLCLTFRTGNGGASKIIFKKGDDLRKDQLVIQMISLMDRLLKSENLDLHLTPYRVLATGVEEGMVEFIPSISLAKITQKPCSITKYLQKCHPDEDGPFGITAQCLETFVKSCAGYCVITYILGIGDRHLDNLLLRDDGRLFHVDFSCMLGEQPHRFAPPPPPMRLCKEMVEAMGGAESQYYARFKSYCCEAYNILRKSSNLILNLFDLMTGSNIPSITDRAISKLQQNFRLDLDDEDAIHIFQGLINESVSAFFPQVVETLHQWAQSKR